MKSDSFLIDANEIHLPREDEVLFTHGYFHVFLRYDNINIIDLRPLGEQTLEDIGGYADYFLRIFSTSPKINMHTFPFFM